MDTQSDSLVAVIDEVEQQSESKSSGKTRQSVRSVAIEASAGSSAKLNVSGNKFVIRLPAGLRKKILLISRRHSRSMNSEIVLLLGRYFEAQLGEHGKNAENGNQEALDARLRRRLQALPTEKREALLALLE